MDHRQPADRAVAARRVGGSARARLIVAVVGLGLAAGYGTVALQTLSLGRPGQPGAGLFPLMVTILLVSMSVAVAASAWQERGANASLVMPVGADRRRLLLVGTAIAAYVAALPWLGFFLASSLFGSAALRILGAGSWARAVVLAAGLALLTDGLFVRLLEVPMPRGILP